MPTSQEWADANNRRVEAGRGSFKARMLQNRPEDQPEYKNAVAVTPEPSKAHLEPVPTKRRIRQSQKPEMNNLELEALAWLKHRYSDYTAAFWYTQAIRFRLGRGHWYKPDIIVTIGGTWRIFEVKGPYAFRGGYENLKSAASLYWEHEWNLIWKDESNQWQIQKVLP